MTASRTLTDADVEAIAQRVAVLVRETKPANDAPKKTPIITEPMMLAAERELERRGLLGRKRR